LSAETSVTRLHRSYLYAPGSSERVVGKAIEAGADVVILDLEDAVAPAEKPAARRLVADRIAAGPHPVEVHVRVNRTADGFAAEDVRAAVQPGLGALRLPKVEDPDHVRALDALLAELEEAAGMDVGAVALYPTVESAAGAVRLADVLAASPRTARVAFGATDFLADIRASGDDALATLHARSAMVLTSRAAGVGPPVDSVHTHLDDVEGLRLACLQARALGFFGKSVIHPRQLPVVHEVFTPTESELARARAVVAAFDDAGESGTGSIAVDGEFIDAAVVARARALLAITKDLE
jgi:citrate lyase subunit beta / citryl-CoA lyase